MNADARGWENKMHAGRGFSERIAGAGVVEGAGQDDDKNPAQTASQAGPKGVLLGLGGEVGSREHEDMKHEETARAERALVVGEGKEAVAAPMVVPPRSRTVAADGAAPGHTTLGG